MSARRDACTIPAKAREVRGVHRVVIRDGEAISAMLGSWAPTRVSSPGKSCGSAARCARPRTAWSTSTTPTCAARAQAAVAACARVERALELLGDEVPEHLRYAGELRLAHRDASLDELGHHADPPMTKDAVAGRIRRLLAMADKHAVDHGLPGTDANLPPDYVE